MPPPRPPRLHGEPTPGTILPDLVDTPHRGPRRCPALVPAPRCRDHTLRYKIRAIRPRFLAFACGGESEPPKEGARHSKPETSESERIDRSSERDRAKAEERKRLAEALRANLRRRKAVRTDGTGERAAAMPARDPGREGLRAAWIVFASSAATSSAAPSRSRGPRTRRAAADDRLAAHRARR